MAHDRLHLVALRQALHEHHRGPQAVGVQPARDAHERHGVGERHDLAFEVVLRRIDHRHVFPRRKPERAGVLRVVRGKAQRERLRPLEGDHLVLEIEVRQGHGSPNLVKVDWNLTGWRSRSARGARAPRIAVKARRSVLLHARRAWSGKAARPGGAQRRHVPPAARPAGLL